MSGLLQNADHKQSCLHEIVGVTSFGVSCGIGVPTVHCRVAGYLDWIEDTVWLSGNGTTAAAAAPPPEVLAIESPNANRISSKSKVIRSFIKLTFMLLIFSLIECIEYHNKVLESRLDLNSSLEISDRNDNYQCPLSVISYIVDGEDAYGKEFPHMVSHLKDLPDSIYVRPI